MTAEAFNFPWDFLQRVMNRIVNEVHGYVFLFLVAPSALLTLSIVYAVLCTTLPRSRLERSRWSRCFGDACSGMGRYRRRRGSLDKGWAAADMCLDGRCGRPRCRRKIEGRDMLDGDKSSIEPVRWICNTCHFHGPVPFPSTRPKPPASHLNPHLPSNTPTPTPIPSQHTTPSQHPQPP